jgi:hypothetical protein
MVKINALCTSKEDNMNNQELQGNNVNNIDSNKSQKEKNINIKELRFINGLNRLFNECFESSNQSQYQIPEYLKSNKSFKWDENDAESSYAYLLSELNSFCSKWIQKHVEECPLINLTPVFVDYFNYLLLLEKRFFPESFHYIEEKMSTCTNDDKLKIGTYQKSDILLNSRSSNKPSPDKFQINLPSAENPTNYTNNSTQNSEKIKNKITKSSEYIVQFEPLNNPPKSEEKIVIQNKPSEEPTKNNLFSNFLSNSLNIKTNESNVAHFHFGSLSSMPSTQGTFSSIGNSLTTENKTILQKTLENSERKDVSEKQTDNMSFFSNLKKNYQTPGDEVNSSKTEPFKVTPFFSFQQNSSSAQAPVNEIGRNSVFGSNIFSAFNSVSDKNVNSLGNQADGGEDADEGICLSFFFFMSSS